MISVKIEDIKEDFLHYLQQIDLDETILITEADKPVAELKRISDAATVRPFGLCEGEFVVPDDFDEPLPENIIQEFEGS